MRSYWSWELYWYWLSSPANTEILDRTIHREAAVVAAEKEIHIAAFVAAAAVEADNHTADPAVAEVGTHTGAPDFEEARIHGC